MSDSGSEWSCSDTDFFYPHSPGPDDSPLPSKPFNRPTPPPNNLIASIPLEVLSLIFEQAVRRFHSSDRITLALVCRSWRDASNLQKEYRVDTPAQADRLADWLIEIDRGHTVRALQATYFPWEPDAAASCATLVNLCSRTQYLHLSLFGGQSRRERPGRPRSRLTTALGRLEELEKLKIMCLGDFCWPGARLQSLFQSWTKLKEVYVKDLIVADEEERPVDWPSAVESVSWSYAPSTSFLIDLLYSSRLSLTSICITHVTFDPSSVGRLRLALEEAAPRLVTLSITHAKYNAPNRESLFNLDTLAPRLKSIQLLEINGNCVNPRTLFDTLKSLTSLRNFCLYQRGDYTTGYRFPACLRLLETSSSTQLKSIALPTSVKRDWYGESRNRRGQLRVARKKAGVDFYFLRN